VAEPGGVVIEAENLSGTHTLVTDSLATNGIAALASGAQYSTFDLAAGTYTMSARVRSAGTPVQFGVAGKLVNQVVASGDTWQTVTAPVRLTTAGAIWGVMPAGFPNGTPTNPLYVDWVSLAPAAATMTTAGNQILDTSGTPYTPRGINRESLEATPTGWWFTWTDVNNMQKWGTTMVRLQLSQMYWLPSSCLYDSGYASQIGRASCRESGE